MVSKTSIRLAINFWNQWKKFTLSAGSPGFHLWMTLTFYGINFRMCVALCREPYETSSCLSARRLDKEGVSTKAVAMVSKVAGIRTGGLLGYARLLMLPISSNHFTVLRIVDLFGTFSALGNSFLTVLKDFVSK